MKSEDRYHRFVRWSDEDRCYIGYCPDLYFGGVWHSEHLWGPRSVTFFHQGRRFCSTAGIAVGTAVADGPRADPYVKNYLIRLLP